jgi:DNA repair protein RadC
MAKPKHKPVVPAVGASVPIEARRAALDALLENNPQLTDRLLLAAQVEQRSTAEPIISPGALAAHLLPYFVGYEDERIVAVAFDRRRRIVDTAVLTIGSSAFTVVDSRQIFRWALTRSIVAAAVAIAHQHPTGDPEPSQQDIDVTQQVSRAGRTLGIPLLDHMVFGTQGVWLSMAMRGHVAQDSGSTINWIA